MLGATVAILVRASHRPSDGLPSHVGARATARIVAAAVAALVLGPREHDGGLNRDRMGLAQAGKAKEGSKI